MLREVGNNLLLLLLYSWFNKDSVKDQINASK